MAFGDSDEGYGMGLVRSTSFGRKRVFLSSHGMEFGDDDDCVSLKRRCPQDSIFWGEKSALEDLPQEILIRILCGVEHDDLKRLFFVSKAIREASVIAKQSHFAYSTPRKTVGFKSLDELMEMEAPNAPKQSRAPRQRLSVKNLADISVALFADGDLFSEN
ncbi:F-box protein At1g61340-like [Salvia miltiorrhiza]|uniref:F-box protein At1g61340-like n=1 Tax=Salvia miltiorrhiza TaxID=226208 RepID=UPI0025AD8770|nr:F-box protein At1g61340-like [Salvia miltiorrhiza]XP_057764720.1 F-box protein At1g61340-like [Salvia miltiorrhiza]